MAFYSSGVEYGIHSLMCMVDAKGNEREMSVREMAAGKCVSAWRYLMKRHRPGSVTDRAGCDRLWTARSSGWKRS